MAELKDVKRMDQLKWERDHEQREKFKMMEKAAALEAEVADFKRADQQRKQEATFGGYCKGGKQKRMGVPDDDANVLQEHIDKQAA